MRGQWIANLGLIAALIGCRSGSDSADETASTAPSPGGDAPGALAELAESPAGSTLPPPAALDELSPGLFGATEVGVPADWAILDLDPLVAEDLLGAPDADPFAGLLSCASGTLRDEEGAWLSRRFSAPGVPLGERLLTVELLLEIEDDDEFASNVAGPHGLHRWGPGDARKGGGAARSV